MRAKIYSISIIVLLGLLLFTATRQFMADFYWSMAHQDGREPNETIEHLEKCIAIDSENALFHFSLGRAYLREALAKKTRGTKRNEWIRKSIDEFQKAIAVKPSSSDYHFHLGLSYGALAYPPSVNWKTVQRSFERTAILNPTNTHHLNSIGIYYLNRYSRLKNIDRSFLDVDLSYYEKYAAMSKRNYQSYFKKMLDINDTYLGKILHRCFSITQEYNDLKGLIRDAPDDHAFLARFLRDKGMWEEAKAEYGKAINLEPTNPNHYFDFGYALSRKGDFEKAIYLWQKQKTLDPEDQRAYLFLADCFIKLKRFDDALREFRSLISLYPGNINYQLKLIRTLLAAGRVDEAVNEYNKIMEKNSHLPKRTYDAISHYKEKGDYRTVTKILNEALSSVRTK